MQRRQWIEGLCAATLLSAGFPLSAETLTIGRPANVIMVAGGNFVRYRSVLLSVLNGLHKFGLIERVPTHLRAGQEGTEDVWMKISHTAGGNRLNFLPDGYYNYGFDEERRKTVREEIIRRISEKKDVDLILTFGTEPTLDMKKALRYIPIVSLSTSDPIAMGVIDSAQDSGQDNLHVAVVPNYFGRQAQSFYDVFPFSRLGLVVGKTNVEKTGEEGIRAFCQSKNIDFETVVFEDGAGDEKDFDALLASVATLIDKGCDALIFPWFIYPPDRFPELVDMLVSRGIPAFSQMGGNYVARGILLGSGDQSLDGYGIFEANVIAEILDGAQPRSLQQAFIQPERMVINLMTAMQMGWKPPFGLLVSAEKTYTTQSGQ